jgi:hypothetical protein
MTTSRLDLGREIEDALGWLSHQQRDLSEVQRLLDTAHNGGRVPLDVFDDAVRALSEQQTAAAELLRRVRKELK